MPIVLETKPDAKHSIDGPEWAAKLFVDFVGDTGQEHFVVLTLDSKNMPITLRVIHIGNVNSCMVDMRCVFRTAVQDNAVGVIFMHNHPSGDTDPSTEDIEITQKLRAAAKILEFEVLDHIVVSTNGNGEFTSLKRQKLL